MTLAHVLGHDGVRDLSIGPDGVVTSLDPHPGPAAAVALPGLVDAHIHLEKAFLLDRMDRDAVTLADAISMTRALKEGFTPADIAERAGRVIDAAVATGVQTLRCHVEVDDTLGLMALEVILELKRSAEIDLDIVAFPQEGIFRQRTGPDLMREAVRLGVDAIGGIPYNDRDVDEHLDFVFDLAESSGRPLDFHVDLSDDPAQADVEAIIRRTRERGLENRVALGHLTSLGTMPPDRARQIARGLAESGISVACLPATDVFLNQAPSPHRGLTPVRLLLEEGVNVCLATNNIQNPFTPFGRGNLFDIAYLFAEVAHFGSEADAETVIRMMTTNPARALGLPSYGIEVGAVANLVLYPARSFRELMLLRPAPSRIHRRGR